jgi:hypothetical protein
MVRLNRRKLNVDPEFSKVFQELREDERRRLGLSKLSEREFSRRFAKLIRSKPSITIFNRKRSKL